MISYTVIGGIIGLIGSILSINKTIQSILLLISAIIIQNKLKTKLIIHVNKDKLTGCNNEIIIDKLKIKKELKLGDNIIEFTPEKKEDITYTCWMNMIENTIRVIDNKNYFKEKR